jgi:phage terminase large subunit-like protein
VLVQSTCFLTLWGFGREGVLATHMKATELTSAELNRAIIALDREQVKRNGFYEFVRLAWQHIPYNANTPFVPAWHIEEMCLHAEACTVGSRFNPDPDAAPMIKNLIANVPPGYTKSMVFSVLYQAWVWTFRPEFRIMWASYAHQLVKDNAGHLRDLLQSTWYVQRWGAVLANSRTITYLTTKAGGFRFSTTIGGQAIGKHCHAFMVDDPVKPPKENSALAGDMSKELENANSWLKNVFASRALVQRQYVKMVVMQRLAEHDPAGLLIKQGATNLRLSARYGADEAANPCSTPMGGDRRAANFSSPYARVTRVHDPIMLNPDRFSEADENERALGMGGWDSVVAQAQLQQNPAPPGGLIFKKDTFQPFKASVLSLAQTFSVLSVDCNFKKNAINSDVGFTVGGARAGQILAFAAFSETLGFVDTERRIIELLKQWRVNAILIEDKANGPAIIDRLKQVHHLGNVIAPDPKTSKESRAHAANVFYQARSVFHNSEFAGLTDFENALAIFPRGLKKDVVDSWAQAVIYLATSSGAEQMGAMQKMGDLSELFAHHYRLG